MKLIFTILSDQVQLFPTQVTICRPYSDTFPRGCDQLQAIRSILPICRPIPNIPPIFWPFRGFAKHSDDVRTRSTEYHPFRPISSNVCPSSTYSGELRWYSVWVRPYLEPLGYTHFILLLRSFHPFRQYQLDSHLVLRFPMISRQIPSIFPPIQTIGWHSPTRGRHSHHSH